MITATRHTADHATQRADAAVSRMRRAGLRFRLAIALVLPVLLLGGCATGSGPSQGAREHAIIGFEDGAPRTLLLRPVAGARLSSPFGERPDPMGGDGSRMHRGIDFAAPIGTPVRAAGDGTVVSAEPRGSYGHYVRIRHDATYETAYAHLSRYADGLEPGRPVRQGQVIGYVGSSGRSTGPHLHYEILVDGVQVDPFEVGPSFVRALKDGAFGTMRAVGRLTWSAGRAVVGTTKQLVIEPLGELLADHAH